MNAFAPASNVETATTEDGTVLLDVDQGRFYGLNSTGTEVWQLLINGRSVEQITGDFAARYNAPPERIRTDIDAIVSQLRDRGLLHTNRD